MTAAAKETEATSNVTDPQELIITKIHKLHKKIVGHAGDQIDWGIEVGEFLKSAKDQHGGHGKWLPWVKANLSFGERHARNYMYMAENSDILLNRNQSSDLNSIHDACAYIRAMKKDGVWPPVAKKSGVPGHGETETLTQEALNERKRELDERTEALNERERKLNVKPKSMKELMPMGDIKRIMGILDPKRAPEGQEDEYTYAYVAFQTAIQ